MYYTYILESTSKPGKRYIGHTSDLKRRAAEHNSAKNPHTAKFKPWKIKVYIAFETKLMTQRFERYLKSGSGHAFAKRRFFGLACSDDFFLPDLRTEEMGEDRSAIFGIDIAIKEVFRTYIEVFGPKKSNIGRI